MKTQLRKIQLSDKSQLAKVINNKKIWDNVRNTLPFPYSEKDAVQFINMVLKDKTKHIYVILYDNILVGTIGLHEEGDVYANSAELGYVIDEAYWGKGIATKAVELITKIGLEEIKLRRIFAGVFEHNVGSMKVLEKNGYQKEGVLVKAVLKNDQLLDEHRYYLLRNELKITIHS